ncbi:MAG: hypothetical protein D6748_16050 [Calditrichaeota bacterium]|nr:MAG: hypothetical protein D6748_16050 [Calditrichota bacterium]
MKGFKFKLNKVLEVKNIRLQQQQKVLMEAALKKLAANQELEQKKAATNSYKKKLEKLNTLKAGMLNLYYGYYHQLLDELEQSEELLHQMIEMENSAREELIGIQKEQKILEKLKEHERHRFLEEFQQNEQKQIDEMAIIGFLKKGKQKEE